jgi:hypothetical protein
MLGVFRGRFAPAGIFPFRQRSLIGLCPDYHDFAHVAWQTHSFTALYGLALIDIQIQHHGFSPIESPPE